MIEQTSISCAFIKNNAFPPFSRYHFGCSFFMPCRADLCCAAYATCCGMPNRIRSREANWTEVNSTERINCRILKLFNDQKQFCFFAPATFEAKPFSQVNCSGLLFEFQSRRKTFKQFTEEKNIRNRIKWHWHKAKISSNKTDENSAPKNRSTENT